MKITKKEPVKTAKELNELMGLDPAIPTGKDVEESVLIEKIGEAAEMLEEQKSLIKKQLAYIGEDPNREGLLDTPKRIVKMWDEIYAGYKKNPADILTTFSADGYDQIILLKDIEFYSMCEHHNVPFYGKVHVAYLPGEKIVGISKLARLVDMYSKRMQIQERIGEQVTDALMKYLQPKGAACIIEASHLCMKMRGVGKQNSTMITSSMKGVFLTDTAVKQELLTLIR